MPGTSAPGGASRSTLLRRNADARVKHLASRSNSHETQTPDSLCIRSDARVRARCGAGSHARAGRGQLDYARGGRGVGSDAGGAGLGAVRVGVVGRRLGGVTGRDGRSAIAEVPAGTYGVQARLIGYGVAEVASLVLTAGQTATADFRLVPQAIELNPVVAVGYGGQRQTTPTGPVSAVPGEQGQGVPPVKLSNTLGGPPAGPGTGKPGGEAGAARA